jgi:hypothetical protein
VFDLILDALLENWFFEIWNGHLHAIADVLDVVLNAEDFLLYLSISLALCLEVSKL